MAYFNIELSARTKPARVHVLTTHAATGGLYPAKRLESDFKETSILKPLTDDHKNVFFCGDFNITRFSNPSPADKGSWYSYRDDPGSPEKGGSLIDDVIHGNALGTSKLVDLFKDQDLGESFTSGGREDTLATYFNNGNIQEKSTIDFHFSNMGNAERGSVFRDWVFNVDGKSYSLSDHFPVMTEVKIND